MATEPSPRYRTGLRVPGEPDALDRMLSDEGNISTDGWRDEIAEQLPQTHDLGPDVRCHMRMGRRLAALSTQCAARQGLSREGWVRKLMAEEVEREMGVSAIELINEVRSVRPRNVSERLQRDDR